MTLLDMVRDYQTLLERKDTLALQTKENNAAIEAAKAKIAQQMLDDDCPRISTGGYSFTLTPKPPTTSDRRKTSPQRGWSSSTYSGRKAWGN